MDETVEQGFVEGDKPEVSVSDWVKKFSAAEKLMKNRFKPKYALAKSRLRADYDVKHKNTKRMTHENVNLVYSIGNSFVNSVYFKAPNCNLTAREEVDHEKVENTEIKTNDWLKDKKAKKVIRRNLWDAYLGGFGARFIDHEYQDIEDQQNIIQTGSPAQVDPVTGQVISPEVPPVFGRIVLKNEIVIQRVRPDLVRFPKGFDFDNYQDSPWIGFDVIMPLSDVKENEAWDKVVREAVEGEKYSKLSDKDSQDNNPDEADDLYAKISYCFIKGKTALEPFKLLVFCHKYSDAPLQHIDYDKGHVGYPIKFVYFNPLDDDESYPNGDCWNIESQLAAVDTWWRKMVRHVERSSPKRLYDSGAISQQEIGKVKANNDSEWVGLTNKRQQPIGNLVQQIDAPQVHPDVSRLYETARAMLSEISPKTGLTRGATDEKVDTATQAKIMQVGEVIDIEARIDDIRDYIVDIILDVAGILEKSLEAPVSIQKPVIDELGKPVIGMDGKPAAQSVQVNKEGFTGKINCDVDVESMQAQNKDVFRRQLLDSLQFLIKFEPVMNKVGKTLEPNFWLERIMETMNIRNVEKGIIDLPPMLPMPQGQSPMGQVPPGPLPPMSEQSGGMPIEATEAGMAERV